MSGTQCQGHTVLRRGRRHLSLFLLAAFLPLLVPPDAWASLTRPALPDPAPLVRSPHAALTSEPQDQPAAAAATLYRVRLAWLWPGILEIAIAPEPLCTRAAQELLDRIETAAVNPETPYTGVFRTAGLCGEQFDANLQMQYLRARYYDQGTGTFASLDPLGETPGDPQSSHGYGYAEENPVDRVDPSGMYSMALLVAVQTVALATTVGATTGSNVSAAAALQRGRRPSDQMGRVRVMSHYVVMPWRHLNIRVFPIVPSGTTTFAGVPLARGEFITLGAGPSSSSEPGLGYLEANFNRENDLESYVFEGAIATPSVFADANSFITELIPRQRNFMAQAAAGHTISYDLDPSTTEYDSANSNSYVAGLLRSVGGVPIELNGNFPGYDKPVRKKHFEPVQTPP